jgi:hypothetical protein
MAFLGLSLVAACSSNPSAPTAIGAGGSLTATNSETGEVLTVTLVEGAYYPHFRALPGSTVTILFPEHPDAEIKFNGPSPFEKHKFSVGEPQTVKPNAKPGSYSYDVLWVGNGTGEVITGGNGSGEVIPVG